MNTNYLLPQIIYRQDNSFLVTRDCDCACVSASTISIPSPITYMSNFELLKKADNIQQRELTSEYAVVYVPSGNGIGDGIAVLNRAALALLNCFGENNQMPFRLQNLSREWKSETLVDNIASLMKLGFLMYPGQEISLQEKTDVLSAWIHITDSCNLRCKYCYLPHKSEFMSLDTGYQVIDSIYRSAIKHNYSKILMKYAGGEPLLAIQVIEKLQTYANKKSQDSGIQLDGVILSNGTLLNQEIVTTIKKLGIRLTISLDGLGNGHDGQRSFANGRGSVYQVIKAIDVAISAGITPGISVTVSNQNIDAIPTLIKWLLIRDIPFSINFYRENIYSQRETELHLKEEKMIEGLMKVLSVVNEYLPKYSLLGSILDRTNLLSPHLRPCGVGQNYLVFDQNGYLSKCQMMINERLSNAFVDDPLEIVRLDHSGIPNISVEQKQECKSCDWRYWCAGGCSLSAHRNNGRYDTKSPNCKIYKALFPKIIELEGWRLLQNSPYLYKTKDLI